MRNKMGFYDIFDYSVYDDDIVIVGGGGGGKTFLWLKLIIDPLLKRGIKVKVWDHQWQAQRYLFNPPIVHSLAEIPYGGSVVYQPHDLSLPEFDRFVKVASREQNFVLAVDEASNFTSKNKISSPAWAHCIDSGRPVGITNVVVSRRPQQLHNNILGGNANKHLFIMRSKILLPGDLDFFKKWVGPTIYELNNKPEHSFLYVNMKSGASGFYMLGFIKGSLEVRSV
jgi:hypothetical protein